MKEGINYNYHIFGLIRGNRKQIEKYVADGPSNDGDEPHVMSRLSHLAGEICTNYMNYLVDKVDSDLLDDRLRYIGFSFETHCDNVIYDGDIFRTQRLSENEQKSFLRHVRKELERSQLQT